jgi:hypothetical protein
MPGEWIGDAALGLVFLVLTLFYASTAALPSHEGSPNTLPASAVGAPPTGTTVQGVLRHETVTRLGVCRT